MDEPKAVIEIGIAEIYNAVLDVGKKVDRVIGTTNHLEASSKDHEARLRSLERRVWALPTLAGFVAICAALVSLWAVLR